MKKKNKKYPIGKDVSEPLKMKIIELLRKHAGADNPREYNYSITAGFGVTTEFGNYMNKNYDKLFGKYENPKFENRFYYPLCMWCYWNKTHLNKTMFKLKDELLDEAVTGIPSEQTVMEWFYEKHKDELIGLI